MAPTHHQETAISREVPLDQLVLPPKDVREGRDPDTVRSIAASMGDPDVGQQLPINVYPNDYDDVVDDGTETELVDLFQDEHPLVIHDGVTRYRAAQQLGWATLWAVIVPEPPENEIVARIDASNERLDLTDYEMFSALHDHYEDTDATLADIAAKCGLSESYVSRIFSLLESPDWLRDPWRHPDHPLETSHALATMALLSSNSIDTYQEAGDLDPDEARQQAIQDAQLMVDVQDRHDLQVGEFRNRVKRCRQETLDELRDGRSQTEKQADGATQAAEQRERASTPRDPPEDTCMVCGDPADRKIAVDVCREDYGTLSSMRANDELLTNHPDPAAIDPNTPGDLNGTFEEAAQVLSKTIGISPEESLRVVKELDSQAAAALSGDADT